MCVCDQLWNVCKTSIDRFMDTQGIVDCVSFTGILEGNSWETCPSAHQICTDLQTPISTNCNWFPADSLTYITGSDQSTSQSVNQLKDGLEFKDWMLRCGIVNSSFTLSSDSDSLRPLWQNLSNPSSHAPRRKWQADEGETPSHPHALHVTHHIILHNFHYSFTLLD